MIYLGINALNHDASIAAFSEDGKLIDHRLSSEFSGIPHDQTLSPVLIHNMRFYGQVKRIYWYEQPIIKKLRQFRANQWKLFFDFNELPRRYLQQTGLNSLPITYIPHHLSHAAAGFYTSPFERAAVVVLDAIGEFTTASIWLGQGHSLKRVWHRNYPNSLGLFYSAFTKLIGFKPAAEEHQLQLLSEQGNPEKYYKLVSEYISSDLTVSRNLHRGVYDWPFEIDDSNRADVAAAVQAVFQFCVHSIMNKAKELTNCKNLVYMGGCAMNSKYNKEGLHILWDKVWSLPSPGDSSSAIGAVLAGKNWRIEWQGDLAKHIPESVQ